MRAAENHFHASASLIGRRRGCLRWLSADLETGSAPLLAPPPTPPLTRMRCGGSDRRVNAAMVERIVSVNIK